MNAQVPDPNQDGLTHLNVYSQACTVLGRFLSNFAHAPFECSDGRFASIEGYWYWLSCTHTRRDELRTAYGYTAKKLGRELCGADWKSDDEFQDKIKRAISSKLQAYPAMLKQLQDNKLPLQHYYVFGKGDNIKVHQDGRSDWIINHLSSHMETR